MTRKRLRWLVVILTAAIALWLFKKSYYLAENGGAQLLCTTEQCYLFVSQSNDGWRKTGLQSIGDYFISFFGGAVRPTDQHGQSIVVAADKSGIRRYPFAGRLNLQVIYRGDLYVSFVEESTYWRHMRTMGRDVRPGDFVYGRWRDSKIEPIDANERKVVETSTDSWYVLKSQSPQDGVWRGTFSGWTWVYNIPPEHPVRIDLQGGGLTFIAREESGVEGKRSILVERDDGQKTVLWSIDESPRPVTAEEYSQLFPSKR